jgi:hypothetical protein
MSRSRQDIFDELHAIGFSVWFDEGPVAAAVARSPFIHVSLPIQYDRLPRLAALLAELHAIGAPTPAELHPAAVSADPPRFKGRILDELHALGLSVWRNARAGTESMSLEGEIAVAELPRLVELLTELHSAAALEIPDPGAAP